MAFETGIASSQEDLISKLSTFAQANGWTEENFTSSGGPGVPGEATLSRGDVFVTFRWDGDEGSPDSPDNIAIYQSLGYSGGADPWNHPDDSGNGTADDTLSSERRISGIGQGPFTSYHFFEDDGAGDPYIHCVLEYAPGIYRHFGFGTIIKFGDWVGGEYAYGTVWNDGSVSSTLSSQHSILLDGIFSTTSGSQNKNGATLHVEGLPGQPANSKWANVGNGSSVGGSGSWADVDRAGEDRVKVRGGSRGGSHLAAFGHVVESPLNGAVPLIPLPLWYEDLDPSPERWYLLGYMRDVAHVQMQQFDPGEELTVGADTWVIFPGIRKSDSGQEESENMGIAYRKRV